MRLVGYGTFRLESGGKLIVKFMGSYPFDFSTWELVVDSDRNIIEVLSEKLNGRVIIQAWWKTDGVDEGMFGVYSD